MGDERRFMEKRTMAVVASNFVNACICDKRKEKLEKVGNKLAKECEKSKDRKEKAKILFVEFVLGIGCGLYAVDKRRYIKEIVKAIK